MATLAHELPDPKALTNWEDAFKYPIPNVRRIEQQLKAEIAGNKERLRSLVGQNYRDLLGTANSITYMSQKCKGLERQLGDVGRRCNSGLIQKSCSRSDALSRHQKAATDKEVRFLAHLAIFRACPEVIHRALLRGQSWLGVARVLVISRLLYSQVSGTQTSEKEIHAIRRRLFTQRRVVLRNLQVHLSRLDLDITEIAEILTAYILISTSSGLDALRFFLQARLSAINSEVSSEVDRHRASDGLETFIQTIRTINGNMPKQLHRLLLKVKTEPIWESEHLQRIGEFDHENTTSLIDDTVRSFVPFIRHDDLVPTKLRELLQGWIPKAFKQTLHSLDVYLAEKNDLETVFDVREKAIEIWLTNFDDLVQLEYHDFLTQLRNLFMGHLDRIGLVQSSQLSNIPHLLKSAMARDDHDSSTDRLSPWTLFDSDSGTSWTAGSQDHEKIKTVSHNTPQELKQFHASFTAWSSNWTKSSACVTRQRQTRWTQSISTLSEEDLRDSQEADMNTLNSEDLALLEATRLKNCSNAITNLLADLDVLVTEVRESKDFTDQRSKTSALSLIFRALRFLLDAAPLDADFSKMTDVLIPTLQEDLVRSMLEASVEKSVVRFSNSTPQKTLWVGDPPLPSIPSKSAFALLRNLNDIMTNAGPDLWSRSMLQSFATALVRPLVSAVESPTSSRLSTPVSIASRSDFDKQRLFDLSLLQESIMHAAREPAVASFQALIDRTVQSGELSASERGSIEASAQAYWTKSSLLFGLLAMR